ncbi:MAG TPA: cyclic nucleotide-binding domain-containing protein [Myxococcales bacterium]|jgi:CRP-like cAMP-binding protein|nr:cyclic nucleotide-binding domain-containing protein [Myxococcales bacterium]
MDIAILKRIPLFEGLNSTQLAKVAGITVERVCRKGEKIFAEGDAGYEFFVIVEGRVRISKHVPGIGEEALAILEPGSYFGEMALVDDTPRSADAIAHTDCLLRVIKRDELDGLMFTDKDIAYTLLWTFVRTLAVRLRETNDKIKAFFAMAARF